MTLGDVTARLPDLAELRDAPDRVLRAVGLERRADTRMVVAPSTWLAFGLGVALGVSLAMLLRATDELESAEPEEEERQPQPH
jgi:hypothetical protein